MSNYFFCRFCGWVDVGLSEVGEREAYVARDTLQAAQIGSYSDTHCMRSAKGRGKRSMHDQRHRQHK
jgi:bisphosphoglycerate-dependent phosphoglycerate mutase